MAVQRDYPLVNLVRSGEGATALTQRFPSVPAIATSDPDWREQARDALGGPVSVILDAVGGELAAELVGLLADRGTLIPYGTLGGAVMPLRSGPFIRRQLRLRGVSVGAWRFRSAAEQAEDVALAVELASARPDLFEVAATYDLEDFREAVEHAGRPGRLGAVLLSGPR